MAGRRRETVRTGRPVRRIGLHPVLRQAVQLNKGAFGAVDLGEYGDPRTVRPKRRRNLQQCIVEAQQGGPVGGACRSPLGMHRLDRRFQLLAPRGAGRRAGGPAEDHFSLIDQGDIPKIRRLLTQRDIGAAPGLAPALTV